MSLQRRKLAGKKQQQKSGQQRRSSKGKQKQKSGQQRRSSKGQQKQKSSWSIQHRRQRQKNRSPRRSQTPAWLKPQYIDPNIQIIHQQNLRPHCQLQGIVYDRSNPHNTNFSKMIQQPRYENALFIFNDNEDDYLNTSCKKGSGNAAIRPYQCDRVHQPRAIGIPTGAKRNISKGRFRNRGYNVNRPRDKRHIDSAINKVKRRLSKGTYSKVFYSTDKKGDLGTNIFRVDPETKSYIKNKLKETVNEERCIKSRYQ